MSGDTLRQVPPLTIAQVTPYPWEDDHDVNGYVGALGDELARRGHRLLVLAPSRSPELVRDSRRLIRAARDDGQRLFDPAGAVRVLGVGELLPLPPSRRAAAPALPLDIARTIEEVLTTASLDVVHVHEPFAPSASSAALRHSRALNVGTFHHPSERVFATQVARRFVELFFGRLDARTTPHHSTADLLARSFPSRYEVIPGGVAVAPERGRSGPLRIAYCAREERAALRLFLRALRQLPADLDWLATIFVPAGGAPIAPLGRHLRDRLRILTSEETTEAEVLAGADVLVAASTGVAPDPALLVRAVGARAIAVAAGIGVYEDVLEGGDLGLLFERGDADTLGALLTRLARDRRLGEEIDQRVGAAAARLSWQRAGADHEDLYARLTARRHESRRDPVRQVRLARRRLIDVDLHMHTDHSSDCATPVEVLLATAREQGLGAIAVTDHNEISGALEARDQAADFDIRLIVGEEVKTAHQGEVIGLFIEEKIPRGLSLQETIAEIKRQGGLVYVPHPFDRLHTVPDYEHLLDVLDDIDLIEVFNPRVAIREFNEEAIRFATKYRIPAGAGSDSHVPQGLGSVRVRMRDFEGPQEFLESLHDADIIGSYSSLGYVQVQAIKFLQTRATPAGAREASRRRRVRRAVASTDRNR